MPIYYEAGGAQQGPVQEDDFKAMVAGGQMPADTMVWREGMDDWQPWRDFATATGRREAQGPTPARVAAGAYDSPNHFPPPPILSPAGTVICVECGGSFAEDEVARFGAQAVCASCKPLFVQRVRETGSMRGSAAGPVTVYATVTRRLAARFLDLFLVYLVPVALLAIFIIPPLPGAVGPAGITGGPHYRIDVGFAVAGFLVCFLLEPWMLRTYGGTPGKLVLGLRVVNAANGRISTGSAFMRSAFPYALLWIPIAGFVIYLMGCRSAIADVEKRAFHDRLFRTRVIVPANSVLPYSRYCDAPTFTASASSEVSSPPSR